MIPDRMQRRMCMRCACVCLWFSRKNTYVFIRCIKNRYLWQTPSHTLSPHKVQLYKYNGSLRICSLSVVYRCLTGWRRKPIIFVWIFIHIQTYSSQRIHHENGDCMLARFTFHCSRFGIRTDECHYPFGWVFASKTFLWDYLCSVKSCRHCYLLLLDIFFLRDAHATQQ